MVEESPLIDADIRKAHTMPSKYYTDPATFASICAGFASYWHFSAHTSDFAENNVLPLTHVESQTGEPMLLSKSEGEIRCLSNVCTHRGMIVVDEPCNTKTLQCPYHARTFGLDGCMRNMPSFEEVENFPSPSDNLPEFATGFWNGLIFTGISPSTSFENWLKPVTERMYWWPGINQLQRDNSRDRDWMIETNWALYVENYLEGFHIPFVHADLHTVLEHEEYSTELFEGGVLQIGEASDGEPCFELPEDSPDFGRKIAAYYWWLYPGLMLNIYPWGLSVNIVVPEEVGKTRVIYRGYVADPEMLGKGAGGDLDKVELEDQKIVEGCMRGVFSSAYDRGRYSPTMETGVHHFHRMLTDSR